MATPEQIAYRRLIKSRRLSGQKRRFENHCKYILGGVLARRLRVSHWDGLGEVRAFLQETNNLDKIEQYLAMVGAAGMNDDIPKIEESESFNKWLAGLVKKIEVEELNKRIKVYLRQNKERIRLGLSRKVVTFKLLAEKLSKELGCKLTASRVRVVWYELLRTEKDQDSQDSQDRQDNQERDSEASGDSTQERDTGDSDTPPPESKHQEQLEEEEIVLIKR